MVVQSTVPHFLIIGAMKSGTTTLYDSIAVSNDVFLPELKEPGILTNYRTVAKAKQAYGEHFSGAGEDKILGEATTHYTMQPLFEDVSEHARDVCGNDVKLLMILRDPVARILSHLRHDYMVGRLTTSEFDAAVQNDNRYFEVSDYATQLEPWLKTFDRSQFHFVDFAKFISNHAEETQKVASFLKINISENADQEHSNDFTQLGATRFKLLAEFVRGPVYRNKIRKLLPKPVHKLARNALSQSKQPVSVELSDETRNRLYTQLLPTMDRLEYLTGFDVSAWRNCS